MGSIFSSIIKGDIPSYRIAENEKFYAFLDINPLGKGHTLVVPKEEIDEFFDLDENLLSEILVFAKPIATAIKKYSHCNRVALSVIGTEVPHAHLHLIPLNTMDDVNFSNPKLKLTKDEFMVIADGIKSLM